MSRWIIPVLAVALVCGLTGGAVAQMQQQRDGQYGRPGQQQWDQQPQQQWGQQTRQQQLTTQQTQMMARDLFSVIDRNQDGYLTRREIQQFADSIKDAGRADYVTQREFQGFLQQRIQVAMGRQDQFQQDPWSMQDPQSRQDQQWYQQQDQRSQQDQQRYQQDGYQQQYQQDRYQDQRSQQQPRQQPYRDQWGQQPQQRQQTQQMQQRAQQTSMQLFQIIDRNQDGRLTDREIDQFADNLMRSGRQQDYVTQREFQTWLQREARQVAARTPARPQDQWGMQDQQWQQDRQWQRQDPWSTEQDQQWQRSEQIDPQQIQQSAPQLFQLMDSDGDGRLTDDEIDEFADSLKDAIPDDRDYATQQDFQLALQRHSQVAAADRNGNDTWTRQNDWTRRNGTLNGRIGGRGDVAPGYDRQSADDWQRQQQPQYQQQPYQQPMQQQVGRNSGQLFAIIDRNADGRLTEEEIDSFADALKDAGHQQRDYVTQGEFQNFLREEASALAMRRPMGQQQYGTAPRPQEIDPQQVQQFSSSLYQLMDRNRDGRLTDDEIDEFADSLKDAIPDDRDYATQQDLRDFLQREAQVAATGISEWQRQNGQARSNDWLRRDDDQNAQQWQRQQHQQQSQQQPIQQQQIGMISFQLFALIDRNADGRLTEDEIDNFTDAIKDAAHQQRDYVTQGEFQNFLREEASALATRRPVQRDQWGMQDPQFQQNNQQWQRQQQIDPQQVRQISSSLFRIMDRNGDGRLTDDEIDEFADTLKDAIPDDREYATQQDLQIYLQRQSQVAATRQNDWQRQNGNTRNNSW